MAVGYDSSSLTLEVEFKNGAVYQYFDVPPHEHEDLMRASSKGKHLNAHVKGGLPVRQAVTHDLLVIPAPPWLISIPCALLQLAQTEAVSQHP